MGHCAAGADVNHNANAAFNIGIEGRLRIPRGRAMLTGNGSGAAAGVFVRRVVSGIVVTRLSGLGSLGVGGRARAIAALGTGIGWSTPLEAIAQSLGRAT
jgi:hypothetical protein